MIRYGDGFDNNKLRLARRSREMIWPGRTPSQAMAYTGGLTAAISQVGPAPNSGRVIATRGWIATVDELTTALGGHSAVCDVCCTVAALHTISLTLTLLLFEFFATFAVMNPPIVRRCISVNKSGGLLGVDA